MTGKFIVGVFECHVEEVCVDEISIWRNYPLALSIS
jgi:hypothetical protein